MKRPAKRVVVAMLVLVTSGSLFLTATRCVASQQTTSTAGREPVIRTDPFSVR